MRGSGNTIATYRLLEIEAPSRVPEHGCICGHTAYHNRTCSYDGAISNLGVHRYSGGRMNGDLRADLDATSEEATRADVGVISNRRVMAYDRVCSHVRIVADRYVYG